MGVAIYPILNKDVPGFDTTEMSGKALAAAVFEPGSTFAVLGNFYSIGKEEVKGFITGETGQDIGEIDVPAEEWFSPDEGIQVVRVLLVQYAVPAEREVDEFAEWLARDLHALEKVLLLAQEHDALFHLAMDF